MGTLMYSRTGRKSTTATDATAAHSHSLTQHRPAAAQSIYSNFESLKLRATMSALPFATATAIRRKMLV